MEYSQAIEICDTFLTFPPRYTMDSFVHYYDDICKKLVEQLINGKTTKRIENYMKTILPMFYSSVKLKSLPAKNFPDSTIFELIALMQVQIVFCLILDTLHNIRNPSYSWQNT
jgi:hypothetical protein